MEIETITVQLGDRQFEVKAAPHGRSKVWRRRMMAEIKPLLDQVTGIQGIEFETPEDLLKLLPLAETVLVNGIDAIAELLISYSTDLEAERDWIEANASDKQIMEAFKAVLSIADPFGLVAKLIGRQESMTSTNSPVESGASTPTS